MKPKMKKYVSHDRNLNDITIDDCYLWKPESFDALKPFQEHQKNFQNVLSGMKASLQQVESELGSHGFNESKQMYSDIEGFLAKRNSLYSNPTYKAVSSLPMTLSSYSSRIKSFCNLNGVSVPAKLADVDRVVDSLFALNAKTDELARKCFIPDLQYYLDNKRRKSTMTDIYIGHSKKDLSKILIGKFDTDSRTYIDHFLIES